MSAKQQLSFLLVLALFVGLLLPNVLTFFSMVDYARAQSIALIAFPVAVGLALYALIGRAWLFFSLQLVFFIWLPFEWLYILRYGAPTSAHVLSILYETNLDEILGYLGGVLAFFPYFIYLALVVWAISYLYIQKIRWVHRSRWWVLAAAGLLMVLAGVGAWLQKKHLAMIPDEDLEVDVFFAPEFGYGLDEYKDTYPFGLVLRVAEFFQQLRVLKSVAAGLDDKDSGYTKKIISGPEIYVVVIGETARADHWSINGYHRATTPLLAARRDLISFSDAVSPASATRTAVPSLVSRSEVGDVLQSRLKNSWITDFKKHGFKTYWFSTQMPVGNHDTMIGAYASLADEVRYLNMGRYAIRSDFDENLLPIIEQALTEPGNKKLIVLHTMGSHAPYHFRYPPSFNYFTPAPQLGDVISIFDKEQAQLLRNAYDNSLRYTDYVLNEILNKIAAKNTYAALWYVADHGETFVDEGCTTAGHGFGSRHNFHVPLIFWTSAEFAQKNPELIKAAHRQQHRPVYGTDFFDTLMQTAHFEHPTEKFNGFLSEDYAPGLRNVAIHRAATTNYDKEYAEHVCGK